MNKKNKNKNRSAKPTPISPQECENIPVKEDLPVQVEKFDSAVKEETQLIVCTATAESLETKDESDNDSPKKPKRNRGKKKKQEQEKDTASGTTQSDTVVQKSEVKDAITSTVEETPALAPASRKKKGKNKADEKPQELTPENKSQEVIQSLNVSEPATVDIGEQSKVTSELPDSSDNLEETKAKKRNRKGKKKRSDSERSDKNDEVLAAFQKILQPKLELTKPEMLALDADSKIKDTQPKPKNLDKDISNKPVLEKIKDTQPKPKNLDKDISNKPVLEKQELKLVESTLTTTKSNQEDVKAEQKVTELKQQAKESDQCITANTKLIKVAEEHSPAEINRSESNQKRKNKKDKKHQQSEIETQYSLAIKKEVQTDDTIDKDNKDATIIVPQVATEKAESAVINPEEKNNILELGPLEIEKGSPKTKAKIAKPVDKKNKNKQEVSTSHANEPAQQSIKIEESILAEFAPISTTKTPECKDILEPRTDSPKLSCDLQVLSPPAMEQGLVESEIKFIPMDEKSKNKSHKKSPKPQRKSPKDIKLVSELATDFKPVRDTLPEQKSKETVVTEEDDVAKEVPLQAVAEGEITPDQIEHPRSASEQFMDSNNNTVIHEMSSQTHGFSITIPDTPLIESSIETPITGPGNIMSTSISVTEIETLPEEPVKTDLKSKVLEVNRDMEELRLSIERSLAELTALDKTEEKTGFEIKPIKTEGQTEIKIPIADATKANEAAVVKDIQPAIQKEESISKIASPLVPISEENVPTITEFDIPVPPQRKENKGKNKSKKKGKQETTQQTSSGSSTSTGTTQQQDSSQSHTAQEESSQEKSNTEMNKSQGKQQSSATDRKKQSDAENADTELKSTENKPSDFEPIDNFEDAMTTSSEDVNKSFELLANEDNVIYNTNELEETDKEDPDEDHKAKENKQEKETPVTPPKNLLGHPKIPAPSNKIDYKKEKNKTPNTIFAKVKIKDSEDIEKAKKESKESQTEGKPKIFKPKNDSVTCVTNDNEEYVYKYSFRKVFLANTCHVCKKELKARFTCNFCCLIFYCSQKHKEDDWSHHQPLCFAVTTITHLKGTKNIYADAPGISGENYRLLRMQTILSCEKILKRTLEAWEQECLLYPRVCADAACREWRQGELSDCSGCGQISYCSAFPDHLPKTHARWCASYSLYHKLVVYQLTKGRLEPPLPTKVLSGEKIIDNINRLLAEMYDSKIDMTNIQYAALTQLATAPLTAAYSYQLYKTKVDSVYKNGIRKNKAFTVHIVNAELQFEADSLHKWETFFLHIRPDVDTLTVVLVGADLNPSQLPLELLGKIKLCPTCRVDKRRLQFQFFDKHHYHQYFESFEYSRPDIMCAFNPSINRSSSYIKDDPWTPTINSIFKSKVPFLITSYTMNEMQRDLSFVKKSCNIDFNTISEPMFNPFASVRPDRNFISDDEMPLLFKNYCYMVLIGAF